MGNLLQEVEPRSRLHLGASRLETLTGTALGVFVDESWIHLGDPPPSRLRSIVKRVLGRAPGARAVDALYRATYFQEFFFANGDSLKFGDNQFRFIYSEHLFQHLVPDLAQQLFAECYRVLKRGGVVRTCVPDAEFRTYEAPEPPGFPAHLPPGHRLKHRSRWSVYSLSDALRAAGFRPVPLTYCTREGEFVERHPPADEYKDGADHKMVMTMSYIDRRKSLIVDGVKD